MESRLALTRRTQTLLKVGLFLLCLAPFLRIFWDGFHDALTANPVTEITHRTGDWTLRLLLITLAITPLRRLSGWRELIRFRRMLGNFAFFYVCLHLLTYLWLDRGWMFGTIFEDIAKRPYITVGFTAYLMLLPLAVTSTKGWVRRLGGKRWQRLHRLIYFAAFGGAIHFYWLVKADKRTPLLYGAILLVLLGYRFGWSLWKKKRSLDILPPEPRPAGDPTVADPG